MISRAWRTSKADAPRLIPVDEHGQELTSDAAACSVTTSLHPDLEHVRLRTHVLTGGGCALAFAATVVLWRIDGYLALLPITFVLGWLNLVGF